MSFFIRSGNTIKQNENILKKSKKRKGTVSINKSKRKKGGNEDIDSDDEDEVPVVQEESNAAYESGDDYETAQEKKVRLAKLYLEEIERKERRSKENGEVAKEDITNYLKEDLKEKANKYRKAVADLYSGYDKSAILTLRCKNHFPLTCVVVSYDNKYIYSGSKRSLIVKWSLKDGKQVKFVKDRKLNDGSKKLLGNVLCLTISSDNKFLVSGCTSKEINVWNADTLDHIHTFCGHKDAVTGLAFQRNHHTLFSVSADRSVKVWNLTEMTYVESLFGHQNCVTSVDALLAERAITSGEDNSIHLWKVVEESQLIYNANSGVECVKFINEGYFLSGGSNGALCLWGVLKKRPLYTVANAHGVEVNNEPRWITSISTLLNTDLVASGSCDGSVKVWKCHEGFKKLELLFDIPVQGYVNGLHFTHDGKFLVIGIAPEHRLGRWTVFKEVKSCVLVVPLRRGK